MPLIDEIGDTTATHGEVKVTIEWNIPDFYSLSDKVDDFYKSPFFSFAGTKWCLQFYPNGETRNSSSEWMGLYLSICNAYSGSPKAVYFTFGIKGFDEVEKKSGGETKFSKENKGWGVLKFCERSTLRQRKATLLPSNVLTITCVLRTDAVSEENKLGKSLLALLQSKDDSDVVIKVNGKEFPAHRVILRARSPVFHSMFKHDMLEKKNNVITIEDCDSETFPDFLVHIYSGSCEHISEENVYSLYTTADKYDMGVLKTACAKFMSQNITVDCFCAVIALAVKHSDKSSIECTTDFFCQNTFDIVKTAEWQTFLKDNSNVGNELFIKAVSK